MAQSSTSYTLLHNLSERQARSGDYIELLLSGFDSAENDDLLSLIRSSGLSPRGRTVNSEHALLSALAERSWDLMLCTPPKGSELSPEHIAALLANQGRDLPIIQLQHPGDLTTELEAMQQGIARLVDRNNPHLIVAYVLREFQQLNERRKLNKLEFSLEQSAHLNDYLIEQSNLAIVTLDGTRLIDANPSFRSLFSLAEDAPLPSLEQLAKGEALTQLRTMISSPHQTHNDLELTGAEGSSFSASVELIETRLLDRSTKRLFIDALGSRFDQQQGYADHTDADTKDSFHADLDATIEEALNGGHDAFLVYLSLTRTGAPSSEATVITDEDLQKVRRCLRRDTGARSVAALENSDFALILPFNAETPIEQSARRIVSLVNSIALKSLPHKVVNLGIARINDNAPNASSLLVRAQKAALAAIDSDSRIKLYRDDKSRLIEISEASEQLEDAIRNHRLKILYQPMVALHEEITEHNFEILARMQNEQNQELAPAEFMQSLEYANIMVKLDRWVVENALMALKTNGGEQTDKRLFINIARRTLRSKSFVPWLAKLLTELNISGQLLIFELSETDAAADLDFALVFSKAVRRVGGAICIKHFGCSTSSDRVFGKILPEYVKLDGSFIHELGSDESGQHAIQKLLVPARQRNTRVIAPLIEEVKQLGELYRIGIDLVQGYYLQPPQPNMEYEYFKSESR